MKASCVQTSEVRLGEPCTVRIKGYNHNGHIVEQGKLPILL